ncbi:MAG: extensin family protein [Betaproteobacteria bacterium]
MKAVAALTMLLLAIAIASAAAQTQTGAGASSQRARSIHSGAQPRALPLALPEQFAPPQETYASFPEPGGSDAAAPPAPSACQVRLAKVATFQALGTLIGAGDCGAPDAVQLQAVVLPDQTKVAVTPPATLRCPMAEQVADWLRDDVAPTLAESEPPLRVLDNFDSYECRGRNRVRAAALSEHGRADALDVRGFRLADGRDINLTDIGVAKDLRQKIRGSACARFSTVLGPGSDGYHEEHVHLDLAERRNGYKLCQWDVREPPPVEDKSAPPADEASEEAEPAGAIAADEVPLPRPRPLAANLTNGRTKKSETK